MKIVTVFDAAIKAYNRPFVVRTIGEAERSFRDEVNNPQSPMAQHPADYQLFHIGDYDDETGIITPKQPEMIITATQAKKFEE